MGQIAGYHGEIIGGKPVFTNHADKSGSDIDWLLYDYAQAKKVAYDLDYFAAVVFKSLDLSQADARKLINGKLHLYRDNQAYNITYYQSKYLGISKGAGRGKLYAGFYNAEQYFGSHYNSEPAQKRAQEARDVTVRVSQILFNLGLDPDTLTSPVRSMEKSILRKLDLPTHLDIPSEVNDLALKCCPGSWVEAYQIGYWDKAYDLDITSCYPSVLAELYDTRRGVWKRSSTMPAEACYGFAKGVVSIKTFSPIAFKVTEELTYTPVGTWKTYLTKEEIDFIYEWNLGGFKIDDAWWYIPEGIQNQPLKGVINHLFNKRGKGDKLQEKILKRCLSGLWGRTLHTHYDRGELVYGDAFNPVFGCLVEVGARLEVARMILENNLYPDHLLHIAVDGVLTDIPVELTGAGLGKWKLSHTGGTIIINSGVAAVENKIGAEDFSVNYEWLLDKIREKPRAKNYTMSKIAPVTLHKALNEGFDRLGELEETTRSINIGQDSKRLYQDTPKNGGELLKKTFKSEPLDVMTLLAE